MTSTIRRATGIGRRAPASTGARRTTSTRKRAASSATTGTKRSSSTRAAGSQRTAAKKAASRKPAAKKAASRKPAAKKAATRKPAAKKAATRKPAAGKPAAKKPAAKKSAAKKAATRKPVKKATARASTTSRKAATRKPAAKKAATRKPAAKKAATRKAATKKAATRKSATRKAAPSRQASSTTRSRATDRATAARRAPASRSGARKTTTARTTGASSRRSTSSRTAQARSRRPEVEEAPAAFRARRRSPEDEKPSRRQAKKRSAASGRSGRGRSRRGRSAVTDAGERNAAFLTATVLGLTLFGLVMVLSASSVSSLHQYADSPFFQFKRQVMWAGIGALAFIVASRVDYRVLRPLATPLLLITIALLVALFVPGVGIEAQGSTRWLGIGPLVIQPSELAKLVFIIFIADLLARRERRMDRPDLTIRPVMLVLVLLSALMILQPKLGTPIILGAISILVLFVAGARMRSLMGWLLAAVLAASLAAYLVPYRRARLLAFLNPWDDPQGIGLQAIQSQVGISSGGWYGVGLGASRAKWGFLPFAHTDFIFAIVAEEVGLIGASALIGGFLLIAWFGFRAAISAPDRFGSLLAAGITSWLLVQAFLNIGMVLGVMPITGEALPFVSAGGSSLVTTLAAAGLLTNVSRRSKT